MEHRCRVKKMLCEHRWCVVKEMLCGAQEAGVECIEKQDIKLKKCYKENLDYEVKNYTVMYGLFDFLFLFGSYHCLISYNEKFIALFVRWW